MPPWQTITTPPDGCRHSHPAGQLLSELPEPPPDDDSAGGGAVDSGVPVGVGVGSAAFVITVLMRATVRFG